MAYSNLTINDRNPIKRWLQGRRLSDAMGVMKFRPSGGTALRVLDFGAGDGELVRRLAAASTPPLVAVVYETSPTLMVEARANLASIQNVKLVNRLAEIEKETFDWVFCLEVFEHLPEKETSAAIDALDRLLKADGFLVVGVPHELHLPALLKGLFRIVRRRGDFDSTAAHVARAVLGSPPKQRPTNEIAPGFRYHPHHLGFDYRCLELRLAKRFQIVRRWFSPCAPLRSVLNSEVYYLLRKRSSQMGKLPDSEK